jgi:putative hydrolase
VGSLAEWVMASFDAGVPVMGEGPITYVVPRIDAFAADHGFETRDVHLWVALHEACHRAMYRVPFTGEHLSELVDGFASKLKIGPDTLMELMQGFDPSDPSGGIDPDRVAGMFDNPESEASRKELEAFLGLAAGYRRLLVERAAGNLLPGLAELEARRDEERTLSEAMASSAFAATFVQPDAIAAGRGFCEEVAVRFGEDAVRSMWTRQGRFPAAAEIADPTAWAARVLLEDLG